MLGSKSVLGRGNLVGNLVCRAGYVEDWCRKWGGAVEGWGRGQQAMVGRACTLLLGAAVPMSAGGMVWSLTAAAGVAAAAGAAAAAAAAARPAATLQPTTAADSFVRPPPLQCVAAGSVPTPCTATDTNCLQCNWNNQCTKCKGWDMYVDPTTKKVRLLPCTRRGWLVWLTMPDSQPWWRG